MLVDVDRDIQALSTQIKCYHMYYGIKRNVIVIKPREIRTDTHRAIVGFPSFIVLSAHTQSIQLDIT
jgi:hypothetical protein